jgi:hypothetical protein
MKKFGENTMPELHNNYKVAKEDYENKKANMLNPFSGY